MITEVAQRWRARRGVYRPTGEPLQPHHFEVAAIPDDVTARAFVVAMHYSGSYPAARRRVGLYTKRGALVGVAVFSQPMHDAVLRPWTRDVAVELGRLVLLDTVPGNGESWFLRRAFALLAAEGFEGVVSYSDPEPRTDDEGKTVFVGHIGGCYQASNACYQGRATPRTLHLLPDGTVFSDRALQKLRTRERGWEYAAAQLVAHGATPPTGDLRAWVTAWLPRITRVRRHHGNHRYLFPLSRAAKKAAPPSLPYPKFEGSAVA